MAEAVPLKSDFKVVPLSRDTLQDRVYRQITDLILDGGIAPGQLVTIQALADALGVSTMPVREAFKRLTAASALTVVSGRSIGIPQLSRTRLDDLRDVRVEVEATAAAWAADRITDEELAHLERQFHELERANATGDVKAYLRANHAFHFTIYRAARSPSMLLIIEGLWLQISPYFNLLRGSGNYTTANEQHEAMLRALRAHDAEAVRGAIRSDIEAAYLVLLGLLPQR